jgi:Kef-type K+ transport system membrane component KefB
MMRARKIENFRKIFFYISIMGGFTLLIFFILDKGLILEEGRNIVSASSRENDWAQFLDSLIHNFKHPLAILLAQVATIILVARFFGYIFKKVGQPTVVGEIIAGIVLGPSLLASYFPEFSAVLFPANSLGNLQFLSQIGLILFMFVIGMELDLKVLRNQAHDAVVVSHASIVVPFTLGIGLAYFIYQSFAPAGVEFSSFGLFMGIAMSITAFPVLARIVQERGIQKTKLGTIVITCAAADDITAWCILAAVIAIVKAGSFVSSLYVIALAIGYVMVMIYMVKPFLKRIGDLHTSQETLSKPIVAIFFLTLILSSYATEVIGIHALFGAFMTGAIIPENVKFRSIFIEKVEDVAVVLLLPLFFVFTGLRTQIGLLDDPSLWLVTGIIILVAVTGKFFGSAIAAKFVGHNWKDSLTIGTLMNTRGLMELVVLNIGYDLGVLSPEIFAMMVIMALVTTMMTGPALDLINFLFKEKIEVIPHDIIEASKYKVLISFGNPQTGRSLVRLASNLTKNLNGNALLTAMHLSPTNELHHYNIDEYERESFEPVLQESKNIKQKVTTLFKASNDIESDISEIANKGGFDLLLIGVGQSIFQGSLLGKILGFTTGIINPERLLNKVKGREKLFDNSPFDARTQLILSATNTQVGIYVDRDFDQPDQIFIPVLDKSDAYLLEFAQRFINNSKSQVVVLDMKGAVKASPELKEHIRMIEQTAPNHIAVSRESIPSKDFLKTQKLMLISLNAWKYLIDSKSEWLSEIPSTLIITGSNSSQP